jgi:hypothetical protein
MGGVINTSGFLNTFGLAADTAHNSNMLGTSMYS